MNEGLLVIDGVAIPRAATEGGWCAAFVAKVNGEHAIYEDRAYCPACGRNNEFYHETCPKCGAAKPWIYRAELKRRSDDGLRKQEWLRRRQQERPQERSAEDQGDVGRQWPFRT